MVGIKCISYAGNDLYPQAFSGKNRVFRLNRYLQKVLRFLSQFLIRLYLKGNRARLSAVPWPANMVG